MTCEVAVLNRLGLALAADSAVTFNSQTSNQETTTYSSGANKIFQLTEKEPVGLMVFNNATLQGVPWELIVKTFRANFADKHCNRLSDYKAELVTFIEQHAELFPQAHRDSELKAICARGALSLINYAKDQHPILFDPAQTTSHANEWAAFVEQLTANLSSTALASFFVPGDVITVQEALGDWLSSEISKYLSDSPDTVHLAALFGATPIADLAIEGVFKYFQSVFGSAYTGVVLAGYGSDDYFPTYCEMNFFGFVVSRIAWQDVSAVAIDHSKGSAVEAFARKAMVETFLVGAAPSIWSNARSSFKSFSEQACLDALAKAGGTLQADELNAIIEKAQTAFEEAWRSNVTETHYDPLLQIVSSLTVEEMSELAETLVMLESLKEKVTSRTQSVGGPVDVAVITKAEGLVWIKRKLFFSPELNHRYFLRQK